METAPGMEILVLNVMEYVTLITRGVLIKHLLLLLGLIIIVEEASTVWVTFIQKLYGRSTLENSLTTMVTMTTRV